MSKSPQSKMNFAARREMRLRRHKTATALFAAAVAPVVCSQTRNAVEAVARHCIEAADILLAALDATEPKGVPDQWTP